MTIEKVQKILEDHKKNKSKVETADSRILAWNKIKESPHIEIYGLYFKSKAIGMPKALYNQSSPVENEVFENEIERELSRELVQEWIDEEESKTFWVRVIVEQVESALRALTKQEKYIIECKYFEDWFWRQIEIQFNDAFRGQEYITESGLKKKNKEALEKLAILLEPIDKLIKTPEVTKKEHKVIKNGPVISYKTVI